MDRCSCAGFVIRAREALGLLLIPGEEGGVVKSITYLNTVRFTFSFFGMISWSALPCLGVFYTPAFKVMMKLTVNHL